MIQTILTKLASALLMVLTSAAAHATDEQEPVTVFAAASLTDVLPELAGVWADETGRPSPRFSFGPSATMARQVAAGAPAHIVLSANPKWIAFLAEREMLAAPAVNVVQNRLVLVVPGTGKTARTALDGELLLATMGANRLAIADPAIAPAGAYAKSYIERLGLWGTLAPRLAMGSNVRQTLALVERGGLPGFVYATDARRSTRVDTVAFVPLGETPPILYAAGRTDLPSTDADSFFSYLTSDTAASIWEQHGFEPVVSN